LLEEASILYGGEFLPEERYSDWIITRRESLQRADTDAHVHFALATVYDRQGLDDLGIAAYESALSIEPAQALALLCLADLHMRTGRFDAAGVGPDVAVSVHSIEAGPYAQSNVNAVQTADPDTLLALEANGAVLSLDHGYPVRLIGPGRPGVLQTKWLRQVVVA